MLLLLHRTVSIDPIFFLHPTLTLPILLLCSGRLQIELALYLRLASLIEVPRSGLYPNSFETCFF